MEDADLCAIALNVTGGEQVWMVCSCTPPGLPCAVALGWCFCLPPPSLPGFGEVFYLHYRDIS